ncbi:hypothetical protein M3Y99_01308100 [Aphelenchoides fujianensis]|nr:hypothetical protein M3Y99_01308100 [Aphelenchoides fujianensis]
MLDDAYEIAVFCFNSFSFGLQSYVIWLIVRAWDLAFSIVDGVVLAPRSFFPMGGMIVRGLGRWTPWISFLLWLYCFLNVLYAQLTCLLYRLVAIQQDGRLRAAFLNGWCKAAFFHPVRFRSNNETHLVYAELNPEEYRKSYALSMEGRSVAIFGDADKIVMNVVSGGTLLVYESLSIGLLVFILRAMRKTASRVTTVSADTQRLQRSFVRLLAAQVSVPFVYLMFPVGLNAVSSVMSLLTTREWIDAIFYLLSLYGFSNAVLTLLMVKPYREHAFRHVPLLNTCARKLNIG